jgi:carboxyl-terminal processing protease
MSKFRGTKAGLVALSISLGGLSLGFMATEKVMAVTKSRFEKLELFNKVMFLIESQYYREVDTEKLIEGAIKGMMQTLDPHSAFLEKSVFDKMQEDTQGEFGGLGLEVSQKDGVIIVITPIDDTPAFKAGIKPGDRIVEIDHESTVGMNLEEAVEKMRGKPKTKISVGIVREGVEGIKTYDLMREVIKTKPVREKILSESYSYVRLTQFQKRSAEEISKALQAHKKTLEKKGGVKGIILDLRSNPGGLLDEAVDVSSIFMSDGVVVSTEGRDPKNKEIRYVKKTGYKDLTTPVIVLINGASASASEIVAGALQDANRALIMGSQSFGKGSVQTVAKVDEHGVKLTIAQYMTPNNRKIQAIGIKPDVELDEVEGEWTSANKREPRFIREKDLRNHLTATIETEEEKVQRLEAEKQERIERMERIKKMREEKKNAADGKKTTEDGVIDNNPEKDYLVNQAINYLKTYPVFKGLNNKN